MQYSRIDQFIGQHLLHAGLLWILPNFLFWYLSFKYFYQRPLLNIDYIFPIALLFFNFRILGFFLYLLMLIFDCIAALCEVLSIFEPWQTIQLLTFFQEARLEYKIGALLFIFFVFLNFSFIISSAKNSNFKNYIAFLAPFILMNLPAYFTEYSGGQVNMVWDKRFSFVGSQIDNVYKIFYRTDFGYFIANNGTASFSPLKTQNALERIHTAAIAPANKIFLSVVESWGVSNDSLENEQLLGIFKNNPYLQIVESGLIKFHGGTVSGELRELCRKVPSGVSFGGIEGAIDCAPKKMQELGYKTVALTAASGTMYRRNEWYYDVGFDQAYFMNNYPQEARRCYSFPSMCDVDLVNFAAHQLNSNEKVFFYWLSTNSHLPYDERDLYRDRPALCRDIGIDSASKRCTHHQLLVEYFEGLNAGLFNRSHAGLEVILVGDHAPPFLDQREAQHYSQDFVPFVHMRVLHKPMH